MKKVASIMLMALLTVAAAAQVKYQATGSCPAEVRMVYVYDVSNRTQLLDSVAVKNGQFALSGTAMKDALLGLVADERNTITIFFNDGEPVVVDMRTGKLQGSPMNNRLNAYDCKIDSIGMVDNELAVRYGELLDENGNVVPGSEKELMEIMDQARALGLEEMATYAQVMGELDNLIPMVYLDGLVNTCNAMGQQEMKEKLLSEERPYYQHPMGRRMIEQIRQNEQKMELIGQPFIDLEEADMDGVMHRLSDYCGQGNYVLVDFWASWCGPCMAEMPNVKANYEKYHAKGFQIVGLSFDQKAEAWKKAVRDKELSWTHLSDLKGWQTVAASTYNINSIPSSLLVDPNGIVVARDLRGEKLGEKLREIYGF